MIFQLKKRCFFLFMICKGESWAELAGKRHISPVECGKGFCVDDLPRKKNVNYLLWLPEVFVSCQVVHDAAKPQLREQNMEERINSPLHPSCRLLLALLLEQNRQLAGRREWRVGSGPGRFVHIKNLIDGFLNTVRNEWRLTGRTGWGACFVFNTGQV